MEYRSLDGLAVTTQSEQAEQEKMLITGYLLKFGEPTILYKDDKGRSVCEVYDTGCVDVVTDLSNCVMRYNHNDDYQILARTSKPERKNAGSMCAKAASLMGSTFSQAKKLTAAARRA